MQDYRIEISGMGCQHCINSVTSALRDLGAEVNTCAIGFAEVCYAGVQADLVAAIEECGFSVSEITVR